MNQLATLLVVLAVIVAIIDWIAVGIEMRAVEFIAKPAVMLLLIGAALVADLGGLGESTDAVRVVLVAGLTLSLAGDVLLVLPGDRFVAGLAAFLLAHLAYIVNFSIIRIELGHPLVGGLTIIGMGVVLVGVGWLGRDIMRGAGEHSERLRAPVAAYVAIISIMVVAAYSSRTDILIAGSLLFYASDATLGWNRFVSPIASAPVIVMISYHLAQLLFVVGVTAI